MQRQRVTLQPVFLLHQSPYRDSSSLLELISRDYGRIGLIARGVRRPKSSLRSTLQAFQPLLCSWVSRGDLGTLTGAELSGSQIRMPPAAVNSAYYMNELLVRLTRRHDPHPQLYDQYARAVGQLKEGQRELRVLRLFELRLLEELGYGLDLRATINGDAVREDGTMYSYQQEHGLVEARSGDPEARQFCGRSLLSLANGELEDDESRRDARRLLQSVLDMYLGAKPLQVRKVARAMQRGLR
ncbi:MAG: DNA repair protein RecO [Gammaproteobacteria bacterium]|nr:DNA repair protein RecO [Gammaproteobacteria bacterium]